MEDNPKDDTFDQEEAQRRFEATLRGALKTPPQHREAQKKPTKKRRGAYRRASSASAKSGQPGA
jgi:hypothetical protein